MLTAVIALTACGGGAAGGEATSATLKIDANGRLSEPTPITITMAAKVNAFTDVLLAEELGEFKKRNLIPTIEVMKPSDGLVLLAQGGGKVDVQAQGMNAGLLNAINNGADVRIAAPGLELTGKETGGWFVSTPQLGGKKFDVSMLRGKKVGVASGITSATVLPLSQLLAAKGMTLDDIELVGLASTAEVLTAMQSGAIFAGTVSEPGSATLEADGIAERFAPSAPDGWLTTLSIFGPKLLKESPEIGKAYLSALVATRERLNTTTYTTDPAVAPVVAKRLDVDKAKLPTLSSFKFSTKADGVSAEYLPAFQEMWLGLADTLAYKKPLTDEQVMDLTSWKWAVDNAGK